MKKFLLVSIGVMILSMAIVGVASANGGPHGNYDAMTDKCAGCHRAHTAKGTMLLVAEEEYAFCLTCHGAGTTGAGTNVAQGVWDAAGGTAAGTANQRLNGGGFESIMGTTTTSKHDVTGIGGSTGTAWGGGTGDNLSAKLECTSCHNPHGNASYRMLKIAGANSWTTGSVAFPTVPYYRYDISANGGVDSSTRGYTWVADQMADKQFGAKDASGNWLRITTNVLVASYGNDISNFCGACHTKYVGPSGYWQNQWNSTTITVQGVAQDKAYAHRSMSSPSAKPTSSGGYPSPMVFAQSTNVSDTHYSQVCLTCHFAHGTTAQMSGYATEAGNPNHVGFIGDSANLFYDNRGVCETCHRK